MSDDVWINYDLNRMKPACVKYKNSLAVVVCLWVMAILFFSCQRPAETSPLAVHGDYMRDTSFMDDIEVYTPVYGIESRAIHQFRSRSSGVRYVLPKRKERTFYAPILINYGKDISLQ